jgi:hypothetical protein
MATLRRIREKVHQPIYDSIFVKPKTQLRETEATGTLKFFVKVQGKTKLETNLDSISYDSFEVRGMHVVISDLEPEYAEETLCKGEASRRFHVTDKNGNRVSRDGTVERPPAAAAVAVREGGRSVFASQNAVTADLQLDLQRLMKLLKQARENKNKEAMIESAELKEKGVSLRSGNVPFSPTEQFLDAAPVVILSAGRIEAMIESLEKKAPPAEQIRADHGVINKLIYNTVTTFFVGEKIVIEMPTWSFLSGSGPSALSIESIRRDHQSATFRFSEPIFIDKQQNFRAEIAAPDNNVFKQIQQIYGPLIVWVVLDGDLIRDVQYRITSANEI